MPHLFLLSFLFLPAAATPGTATPAKPGITRIRSVKSWWLQGPLVNHDRYLINPGVYFRGLPMKRYDLKTGTITEFAFLKSMFPHAYSKRVVHLTVREAGIYIHENLTRRTGSGCRGRIITIPGTGRRFCDGPGGPAPLEFGGPKKLETWYARVDLRTRKMLWKARIGDPDLYVLGVDSSASAVMFYKVERKKTGNIRRQKVKLVRFSVRRRKIDWTATVTLPDRKGLAYKLLAGARVRVSNDLAKIFINEYDERNSAHPRGYLTAPKAQGYILDVASKKIVRFRVPVTTYGAVFGPRNKVLYLSSHQLGVVHRLSTVTGKVEKSAPVAFGAFALAASATGRLIYAFHYTGVKVYDAKTLKEI